MKFVASFQRNDRPFTDEVIRCHNDYRQKHGAQPLRHSPELSTQAQRWAEVLAQTNTFKHSSASIRGESLGENIAMKWSSRPQDTYSGNLTSWSVYIYVFRHYRIKTTYWSLYLSSFVNFNLKDKILHFTKLLWFQSS